MFPQSQVANNKDDDDKDIEEKVVAMIAQTKKEKRHIKLNFWSDLIVAHRLTGTLPDQLIPPQGIEMVRPILNEGVALAHHPNPAKRSCAKLIQALRWLAPPVNRTEVFGLIKGTWESPSLSRNMAKQCQEAMLKCIANCQLHEAEPDYWHVVKSHYDVLLASL